MPARLLGFSLVPMASTIAPFLVLPFVARAATPEEWVAIGIGQSVGMVCGTVVSYGWNLRGVVDASYADASERRELWSIYLWLSLVLYLATNTVALGLLAVMFDHGVLMLASTMSLATSVSMVAPNWIGIGIGRPSYLIVYNALPRAVCLLVGAALIHFTGELYIFPAALALSSIFCLIIFSRCEIRPARISGDRIWRSFRLNAPSAGATVLDSLYSAGFVAAASLLVPPSQLAGVVSIDRLFRFGKQGSAIVTSALQAWIVEDEEDVRVRQRTSLFVHLGVGLVGAVGFALLGRELTWWLFGRELSASLEICVLYGLAFLVVTLSSCLVKHVLVVEDRDKLVLWSTVMGALILVGTLPLAGRGAAAVVAVYVACETAVLLVRIAGARVFVRRKV